ncbi:MAG: TlpA family protein disulfide reductase [Deltaproteobacteria bacterium]|nr:TlpA family protein disulfide reductase [Deltaproteobacteria bacterium]
MTRVLRLALGPVAALALAGCHAAPAPCAGGMCGKSVAPARATFVAAEKVSEVMAVPVAGKVTVLDFWDTKCAPCLAAMPRWEALWRRADRAEVAFVGVAMDRSEGEAYGIDVVREQVRTDPRLKVSFPLLYDGEALVLDRIYAVGPSFPRAVVIDAAGIVIYDSRGEGGDHVAEVQSLLASLGMVR